MATTTTLPAKKERVKVPPKHKSNTQPTRSMTHPLQNTKPSGAKRRPKQGEPFDPDDLSRRLQAYLVEQKLKADRRRDAKAARTAAELAGEDVYHHVPKVAAAQFERTTTADVMRPVPKIVQPAIRAHLELLTISDNHSTEPPLSLKRTQAMDRAMIERDFLRAKSKPQWDHRMEKASEVDENRDVYKVPQRTFNGEFAHLTARSQKRLSRPLSTGDILTVESRTQPNPQSPTYEVSARNDWAQRDDEGPSSGGKKEREVPFMRKMPSSWALLGKKSPKQEKEAAAPLLNSVAESGSPPDGSKSGRTNFLARFKRHPSTT